MSDRERPRGSAVWVGLDAFGDEVVARLARWFTDDEPGRELAAANRLLSKLRIVEVPESGRDDEEDTLGSDTLLAADEPSPPPPPGSTAIRRIEAAAASLLAAQQSREALRWADREVLTPHVWVVADLCSPETAELAEWLGRLDCRLDDLHVEARHFLLLRHLSWGLAPEQQRDAANRAKALVEHLVGETTPGRTSVMAYVLTDRDSVGGYYDEAQRETTGLAFRFADAMLLTDVAHANVPGAERAFVPPMGGGPGGWETLPVFASAAASCLHWDAPAAYRENAEHRRSQLFTALAAPVPSAFDPDYPVLGGIHLAEGGRWPQLDVPRWSPRFWRSAVQEYGRYRDLLDAWIPPANGWRHEMLVIHRDRRQSVQHHASAASAAYTEAADGMERVVLADDSLRGFFAPLHRLYDRTIADLQVHLEELRDVPDVPPPPIDAVGSVERPQEALADADDKLVRALEHKVNPLLLLQVAVMTAAIAWALVAWTLVSAKERLAALEQFAGAYPIWPNERFRALVAGLPDNAQIILWSGVAIVVPLAAIAVFTALRQRVLLERAWNLPYRRALGWRDDAARKLPRDIRGVEQALVKANLTDALQMIAERRARLSAFEVLGQRPIEVETPPDEAVTGAIRPSLWTAQPLSDLQVAQIVASFKLACGRVPSAQWTPEHLLSALFAEATEQADDPVLNLKEEMPRIRRRVLRSMPPDGAVRVQQLASTTPAEYFAPPVARFLATPAAVTDDLKFDPAVVVVLPLPIETRFYAMVVQSGMSARRVLSRPTPWDADPLNPDGGETEPPTVQAEAEAEPSPDGVEDEAAMEDETASEGEAGAADDAASEDEEAAVGDTPAEAEPAAAGVA